MNALESIQEIARRYIDPEEVPDIDFASLSDCLKTGRDPRSVLSYLDSTFNIQVRELQDLLRLNQLGDEDLASFACKEGVALSQASEGWWLVFTE